MLNLNTVDINSIGNTIGTLIFFVIIFIGIFIIQFRLNNAACR